MTESNKGDKSAGIVAPSTRNLSQLADRLSGWLAQRLPEANAITLENLHYPTGAGMSHETILFDAAWTTGGKPVSRGMVVRIKPTEHHVYQDDMFDVQYNLMQFMHENSVVPVAKPLWLEQDPDLLGAPFFVMEKVSGRVAVSYPPYSQEGWMVEASPADRRCLWEDAVRQLAAIQKVKPDAVPFLNLPGEFASGFDQEFDRWSRYVDWVDPQAELSLLRDGLARLVAMHPQSHAPGIVWGDARLGNMMIGPGYKVAAVMDWEQPSLGGALHDLAWWLRSDFSQTEGRGIAPLEGMGSRKETIEVWQDVSGKSVSDLDWFEAFTVFKMDCLSVQMSALRPGLKMPKPGLQTAQFLNR